MIHIRWIMVISVFALFTCKYIINVKVKCYHGTFGNLSFNSTPFLSEMWRNIMCLT